MPGFVKTPKDEARWEKAKQATSRSKDKSKGDFTDRDWALTNYIYHRMSKNQKDQEYADLIKSDLKKRFGGMLQLNEGSKKPSIEKLKAFLGRTKGKK